MEVNILDSHLTRSTPAVSTHVPAKGPGGSGSVRPVPTPVSSLFLPSCSREEGRSGVQLTFSVAQDPESADFVVIRWLLPPPTSPLTLGCHASVRLLSRFPPPLPGSPRRSPSPPAEEDRRAVRTGLGESAQGCVPERIVRDSLPPRWGVTTDQRKRVKTRS